MPLTRVRDPLSHTLFRTMVRAVSCPACLPECPAFFALRASWHLLLAVRTAGRMGFFSARTAHLRRRCGLSCSPWARRSAENTTDDTPNVFTPPIRKSFRPPPTYGPAPALVSLPGGTSNETSQNRRYTAQDRVRRRAQAAPSQRLKRYETESEVK